MRTFAARTREQTQEKKKEPPPKLHKKVKYVTPSQVNRPPPGMTAWAPVDDVYVMKFYPRNIVEPAVALDMIKGYQKVDFTPPDQAVFIELKLDMALEKKKKVDPFVSTISLPHPFKTEFNKVAVFTQDAGLVQEALENGAVFAGGKELIQRVLDDELEADFYLASPDILSQLVPLKNKLRKKFPKSKRGTVGTNIPKMMKTFKMGHEIFVDRECFIKTEVGSLDMPKEHLVANIQTIVQDVATHRPASFGPFIVRAILHTPTTEAVWFNSQVLLPNQAEEMVAQQ